jgi:cytochrome c oxidase cbb3-type subunit 3
MSNAQDKGPENNFDGISERHGQRPPVYFMVLFLGLIVWGLIFMAYYLLSGWSSQQEFQDKMAAHQKSVASAAAAPPSAPTASSAAAQPKSPDGAELFAAHCAVCHGSTGKGGIGPDLTRASYKYGRTIAEVKTSIAAGRANGMPPFGTQLSQVQIGALVDFILTLK